MADKLTKEETVLLQNRLSNEHRITLASIALLTLNEIRNLFRVAVREKPAVFATTLRETLPAIMNTYTPTVAQVSSAYYDNSRELYVLSERAPVKLKTYNSDPVQFMTTKRPLEIIDNSMDEVGYWIGQAVKGDYTPQKIITPVTQLVQKSLFDTSRQNIIVSMAEDDVAQESATRSVKGDGCVWCKHMAYQVGGEKIYFKPDNQPDWRKEATFHKGCNCTLAPAFKNQYEGREPWVDQYEKDYEKARKDIMDYNNSLRPENVEYYEDRVDSRGRTVTEKKYKTVYKDPSGKEAEPISVNTKNMMARLREKSGSR